VIRALRRGWTIRVRLTVLYGSLFFLAGAVLLGVTYVLVAQRVDQQLASDSALTPIVAQRPGGAPPPSAAASRAGADPQAVDRSLELLRTQQERLRDRALNSMLTQGGIALAMVGAVAVGFGWLLAGRALRPLHRITEAAQRIGGADGAGRGLHERIALDGPRDEVKNLADTFDGMLERLDRSFEGQRRFVASASHEMRTPLAINRALIEVAITRPATSADAQELGGALLEVNARHERLVDNLLTLADSENEVVQRHPVDLGEIAGSVLATAAGAAKLAGVEIREPRLDPAPTTGDAILIERLAHNLVDNAVRHNLPADGWVSLRTWSAGGQVMLAVSNTGPAIQRYEVETLFQPFRRGNGLRGSADRGFGLGLSIVRAIAGSHRGTVTAQPHEGGGLVVTVSLPDRRRPI
jgi:signal transduction histidine kinase